MEENYKKSVEKAKSVITALDPKTNLSMELTALKSQLLEKNTFIQRMEKEDERKKKEFENEMKLMSSAFYRLVKIFFLI